MRSPSSSIAVASLLVLAVAAAPRARAAPEDDAEAAAVRARIAEIEARPGAMLLQELEWREGSLPDGPSVSLEPKAPPVGTDGVTARVTLKCLASEATVTDCTVLGAEPAGRGFEGLSLKIAPLLRVRSTRKPGEMVSFTLTYRGVSEPPAEPHVSVYPDWATKPTARQLGAAYPRSARGGGSARISCRLTSAGLLRNCVVVSETPAGQGFGPAALSLAPDFRAWPALLDGQPTGGGTIEIPLIFAPR